jgi:hypothetical protein
MSRVIRFQKLKMKDSLKFNNWTERTSLIDQVLIRGTRMNMMMLGMLMKTMMMIIWICLRKMRRRMNLKMMYKRRQKHWKMIKT